MDYATADRFSFRAWHKEWVKWFIQQTAMTGLISAISPRGIFFVGFSSYPKDDRWIIMQSMDRRDKHGKLIYDGDIINLKMEFRAYEGADPEYRTITGQIRFESGGFWFYGSGWAVNNWHFYNAADIEVIGNIYENERLLNGQG